MPFCKLWEERDSSDISESSDIIDSIIISDSSDRRDCIDIIGSINTSDITDSW